MAQFALKYMGDDGKAKKFECDVDVYEKAAKSGQTLRQYMRTVIHDADESKGHVLDQMMTAAAMNDGTLGFGSAMTMAEIAGMADSSFRRNDGADNSLGARLLFPQVILETINANQFRDDGSDILSIWNTLVATTRNINGTKADQPIIDYSAPEESRSGRIAQLAEPETMINITTGEKSIRIPTYSVGLHISDEAMAATTIDLVRIVMEAQARGNRIRTVNEQLQALVKGDVDRGIAALPVKKIGIYDAAITTNGTLTKRAYIKWLHDVQERANISTVLTDIDTAISIDDALLPKVVGVDASKIATPWGGLNLGLTQPRIIPFKAEVFGASMLVALDPRYAIQRFVNISASYNAIQEYVMRKSTAFRVDYGEMATRLFDEAWDVVSLEKA